MPDRPGTMRHSYREPIPAPEPVPVVPQHSM